MAIAAAQAAIVGCRLAMPDEPRLVMEQEGQYTFKDLPLQPVGKDPPATTHYVQVVEVIQFRRRSHALTRVPVKVTYV